MRRAPQQTSIARHAESIDLATLRLHVPKRPIAVRSDDAHVGDLSAIAQLDKEYWNGTLRRL